MLIMSIIFRLQEQAQRPAGAADGGPGAAVRAREAASPPDAEPPAAVLRLLGAGEGRPRRLRAAGAARAAAGRRRPHSEAPAEPLGVWHSGMEG